jgi:hypothetical protein
LPQKWDPARREWVDAFADAPTTKPRRWPLTVIVLGLLTVAVGSFALTRGGEDRAPVTLSLTRNHASATRQAR